MEWWWIRQLQSADWSTRCLAAEKLAERKCLRAVPKILKLIEEDTEEVTDTWYMWGNLPEALREDARGQPQQDSPRVDKDGVVIPWTYRTATPLVLALWNMGEEALPAIEEAAQKWRDRVQNLGNSGESGRILGTLDALQDRTTKMFDRSHASLPE